MKFISLFNDVLGPVMRGPSSSHTAGSYRIGRIARDLLDDVPSKAQFRFDPGGSYSKVIKQQGVDRGLTSGLMGWPITDSRFLSALEIAHEEGLSTEFIATPLTEPDHPNTVEIRLKGTSGKILQATARSVGGGLVEFTRIEGWPVRISGKSHEIMIQFPSSAELNLIEVLDGFDSVEKFSEHTNGPLKFYHCRSTSSPDDFISSIGRLHSVDVWTSAPVFFVQRGESLFSSAAEIIEYCELQNVSLSEAALNYESTLLDMSPQEILSEMVERYQIMRDSIYFGLEDRNIHMQLLQPTARGILSAEQERRVSLGGPHTRAAARALAVLHTSSSMGTICAAPTGASAGVLAAVALTLQEEKNLSDEQTARALLAAASVGMVVAERATFAAEVAGCQVEIGAAAAMSAAAVVDTFGGSARQAMNAAAISFHNSMGSVCDLVQGICEVPCHTRNAAAASGAFICADLILGGYDNPIPLDETIDAVYQVGLSMPSELRVTSLGGIAVTPSALSLVCKDPLAPKA